MTAFVIRRHDYPLTPLAKVEQEQKRAASMKVNKERQAAGKKPAPKKKPKVLHPAVGRAAPKKKARAK